MPIKKKQKKVVKQKPKNKSLVKTVEKLTSHLGAIEKIVSPKQKEVRVKTFIVEKPVYIQADRKFPARGYTNETESERVYDARRSRYLKRKEELDNDSLDDKEAKEELDDSLDDSTGLDDSTEENFDENLDGENPDTGLSEEGTEENLAEEGFSDEPVGQVSHKRAGITSILSVWWKRAVVFGIIWWLLVLAFILLLQTFNLVTVDINRGWWVFLGIIIALSIVYQKFLSGKV